MIDDGAAAVRCGDAVVDQAPVKGVSADYSVTAEHVQVTEAGARLDRPKLRDPAAVDRWTWVVIACYVQLWPTRGLAADLRLPWQRPAPPRSRRGEVCSECLHMAAEDEICGPAIYGPAPQGRALGRELKDAHEDIREIFRETSLQPPGSPLWWRLATAALYGWARQLDREEYALPASYRRRADSPLRGQLAGQWRAFNEACIRDLDPYLDAPPQLPTCQLRLGRPATPRLASPAFSPLACTCQACTGRLGQASRPSRSTVRT